jgi:hypothetical protein
MGPPIGLANGALRVCSRRIRAQVGQSGDVAAGHGIVEMSHGTEEADVAEWLIPAARGWRSRNLRVRRERTS